MPWIEKLADKLPGWKAALMNWADWAALVRFVLSAIPVHLLIVINVPKWVIKIIDKYRRVFLWAGREKANGGCCLVSWDKVVRPLDLGGLGIYNLQLMGWALQMRWQWLQKTWADRPWIGLELRCHVNMLALFTIVITSQVGNGNNTLFWTDRWLHGCSIEDLASSVVACVTPRSKRNRTVAQALENDDWMSEVQGG